MYTLRYSLQLLARYREHANAQVYSTYQGSCCRVYSSRGWRWGQAHWRWGTDCVKDERFRREDHIGCHSFCRSVWSVSWRQQSHSQSAGGIQILALQLIPETRSFYTPLLVRGYSVSWVLYGMSHSLPIPCMGRLSVCVCVCVRSVGSFARWCSATAAAATAAVTTAVRRQ